MVTRAILMAGVEVLISKTIKKASRDLDKDAKDQVYIAIGSFLEDKIQISKQDSAKIVELLCDETVKNSDLALYSSSLNKAKEIIIAILCHYRIPENEGTLTGTRTVEILFMTPDKTARSFESTVSLPWERMPSEVRADFIKTSSKSVSFNLYKGNFS